MIVLETDRLLLRHLTPGDSEFILRLLNEPSFLQNIGDRKVRNLEQAVRYLQDGPMKSYRLHGHGLYLVALKDSLEPVGMCGLLKRDQFQDVDLGYAFLPEHWSKGFASESASAVLEFGRRSLGLAKTIALVSPGNAGSIRVLEKLGFRFSATVRMQPDTSDVFLYERVFAATE
jgi:RimJ/RimL family protein N-acetyltransferase